MINKKSKIFVAGHNGLVGSAIVRKLIDLEQNLFIAIYLFKTMLFMVRISAI